MASPSAAEQRAALGERLRRARRERGHSLVEVARETELSSSFVSLIETGRSDVSLGRLMRLLDFYGIALGELFREEAPVEQVAVTRRDERVRVPFGREGIEMLLLSAHPSGAMTPFSAVYARGARTDEPTVHAGEAFVHVLEGSLKLTIEGGAPSVVLHAGDSVYLDTSRRRVYENVGDGPAQLVGALLRAEQAGCRCAA